MVRPPFGFQSLAPNLAIVGQPDILVSKPKAMFCNYLAACADLDLAAAPTDHAAAVRCVLRITGREVVRIKP